MLFTTRAAGLRPRVVLTVATVFVLCYGLMALPKVPAVRAVLLWGVFAGAVLLGRRADGLQLLATAASVMLLYHPPDLFDAGFQLSFGTVSGLILFTPALTRTLAGPRAEDVRFDPAHRPTGTLGSAGRWADARLVQATSAAVVAWLVSMPLVAWHFEQVNPWAVPGSLLMSVPVALSLVGGLAKVLLTFGWPGLAEVWATLAGLPVRAMRTGVAWLSALPSADVPLPRPPLWLIGYWFAVLPVFLTRQRWPTLRWGTWGMMGVAGGAMLVWPFVGDGRNDSVGGLRLTVLAVGAGQCVVIEPPSGRALVVDAGSTSLNDVNGRCLTPFLRHQGVGRVETVLVTHPDADHISGIAGVAAAYDVREVVTSTHFPSHAAATPIGRGLLRDLDRLDRPPRSIRPGDVLPLGRGVTVEALWPPTHLPASGVDEKPIAPNDASLVLKVTYAGRTILLPGDVQEASTAWMLQDPWVRERLAADVLIAPHHGSAEPSTSALLDAVGPCHVISSDARRLSGKQVTFDAVMAEYDARTPDEVTFYRTGRDGAVTVTVSPTGLLQVRPFLTRRPHGDTVGAR